VHRSASILLQQEEQNARSRYRFKLEQAVGRSLAGKNGFGDPDYLKQGDAAQWAFLEVDWV
jgi:hypothetical protein